ncbi:MAG: hypothetical protein ABL974_03035 [Prosthecobacter sp.]
MPATDTADEQHSRPRESVLFGFLTSMLAVCATAASLAFAHEWTPSAQFLLLRSIELLVLVMYFWQFSKHSPSFLEAAGILLVGSGFIFLVFKGDLLPASLISFMALAWLIVTWLARRWTLLRGLTTLALFIAIGQASLGGLQALKISDPYGISHGTLSHIFLCLLVLIAFASSRTWHEARMNLSGTSAFHARLWSSLLLLAVFGQLVIGATLSQTHWLHLAASDIFTTQGQLFPPTSPADVFVLQLHKYWGFTAALLVLTVAWKSRRWLGNVPRLRWIPPALLIMPVNQVVLGIYVILTGKSFWVTHLHALNGLGILVLSFLITVSVWASTTGIGLAGEPSPDKPITVS